MNDPKLGTEELLAMPPKDFRQLVREGSWSNMTLESCRNYIQLNLVVLPADAAFEFLLFCNRNPQPCPVVEVLEPGDPHPKQMATEADLRTDIPKYRVWKEGELTDEPTDILKYWRDDLVSFLIGCSRNFVWALRAANVPWRRTGVYCSNIECVPAGRFHGPVVVSSRAFYNTHDAVRAVQISSRHPAGHSAPMHIGDPEVIGITNLGEPDPYNPPDPPNSPPEPGEIIMYWGCGCTPQSVALESKIPFMITHKVAHMFVTDRLNEELSVL